MNDSTPKFVPDGGGDASANVPVLAYGAPEYQLRPPTCGVASFVMGIMAGALPAILIPAVLLGLWDAPEVFGFFLLLWPLMTAAGVSLGLDGLAPNRRGRFLAKAGFVLNAVGLVTYCGCIAWAVNHWR